MMIIVKTEAGQQVMKDRSIPLTPRQRSAFILCDGKRTMDDVLAAMAAMGVTQEDLLHMIGLGLLAQRPGTAAVPDGSTSMGGSAPPVPAPASERSGRPSQQRYQDAYPIATQLTASLGLRGFRLNLAVEAAGSYEQLAELAPKIKDAVGADKFVPLERALHG